MRGPCDRRFRCVGGGAAPLAIAALVGCGSPDPVVLGEGFPQASLEAGSVDDAALSPGAVVSFVLVDVTTGEDLRVLADGDTVNVSASAVSVRAQTEPAIVGSVVFAVDGVTVRTEEHSLYAIAGNDLTTGKYYAWKIAAGAHRVRATPYSGIGGGGQAGIMLEQTFQIQ